MRHAWERGPDIPASASGSGGRPGLHEWEIDGDDLEDRANRDADSGSDSDASEPDPENDPNAAAACFCELLVSLYMSSKLGAWAICTLAYWVSVIAVAAGVNCVKLNLIKMSPKSKNQQRHLDTVLGIKNQKDKYYSLTVPGHARHALDRGEIELKLDLPSEIMERQFGKDTALIPRTLEVIDKLPPVYHNHPVVKRAERGEVVAWAGLYIDGVSYSNTDSCVGIWLVDNIGGSRHLVTAGKILGLQGPILKTYLRLNS